MNGNTADSMSDQAREALVERVTRVMAKTLNIPQGRLREHFESALYVRRMRFELAMVDLVAWWAVMMERK